MTDALKIAATLLMLGILAALLIGPYLRESVHEVDRLIDRALTESVEEEVAA